MNVEEVMKKLEEIKVELYNNVTSSEDKSPVQVETQDRLPIDEDLAGEEVKIERTKGEKIKDRGNMSRSSPQDGSKNPDKDYVFGKNAPSVEELQNQLDGLFKTDDQEINDAIHDGIDVAQILENELDFNKLKIEGAFKIIQDFKSLMMMVSPVIQSQGFEGSWEDYNKD